MDEKDIYESLNQAPLKPEYASIVDPQADKRIYSNINQQYIQGTQLDGAKALNMKKSGLAIFFTLTEAEEDLLKTKTVRFFATAELYGYDTAAALADSQQNEPLP